MTQKATYQHIFEMMDNFDGREDMVWLTDQTMDALAAEASETRFRGSQIIFHFGDDATSIIAVEHGNYLWKEDDSATAFAQVIVAGSYTSCRVGENIRRKKAYVL